MVTRAMDHIMEKILFYSNEYAQWQFRFWKSWRFLKNEYDVMVVINFDDIWMLMILMNDYMMMMLYLLELVIRWRDRWFDFKFDDRVKTGTYFGSLCGNWRDLEALTLGNNVYKVSVGICFWFALKIVDFIWCGWHSMWIWDRI